MYVASPAIRRLSTHSASTGSANGYPHIPPPCRQLHPPKSPLYRPAVLRASHSRTGNESLPSSPKSMTKEDFGGIGEYKRETYSSDEFDDSIGDEICEAEDDGGSVTGPPKRTHWKPDAEATICDAPSCVKEFSFYTRRHHCRRCGNVFCSQHAYHFLPLNQNSRVHPKGIASRVCDICYGDYKRFRSAVRRANSMSSASSSSSISSSPSSPIFVSSTNATTMIIQPILHSSDPTGDLNGVASLAGKVGSYVGSVPRDWSWSTF